MTAVRAYTNDGSTAPRLMAETSKEKVFDLILGIMYFVVAAVEAFCIVVAVAVSRCRCYASCADK